jgi:hypothetical protein
VGVWLEGVAVLPPEIVGVGENEGVEVSGTFGYEVT